MSNIYDNVHLAFNSCWTGLVQCFPWVHYYKASTNQEHYKVLCLGPSGSGKTTVLATLAGEPTDAIQPTAGFNVKNFHLDDVVLDIMELGGDEKIRKFWNRYYQNQNGILYVINADCSDSELKDAANLLYAVISDNLLKNLPCVVLATHSDVKESQAVQQIQKVFSEILHHRESYIFLCGLNDRNTITQCVECLVDFMSRSI